MSRRIVAAALVVGLIGPAAAVELNPKAIAIKQADELALARSDRRRAG